MVAAVFGGSIIVELLRQWWGPVDTDPGGARSRCKRRLAFAGRWLAPALLVFAFLVPVIFYNRALHSRPRRSWC